jgi:RNA polymerase sigma-70 factor (ECF subfamily)
MGSSRGRLGPPTSLAATAPIDPRSSTHPDFEHAYRCIFAAEFARLFRYLNRLGGDADLAADLVQEAFVRLYRRGSLPDSPGSWLAAVATNLFRNHKRALGRRARLLTTERAAASHSDAAPSPLTDVEAADARRRVRAALDRLPDRDRRLLLLRAEGFSYEELADVLSIAPGSVGTLLARARAAFKVEVAHEG